MGGKELHFAIPPHFIAKSVFKESTLAERLIPGVELLSGVKLLPVVKRGGGKELHFAIPPHFIAKSAFKESDTG